MNTINPESSELQPAAKHTGIPRWVARELAGADRAILFVILLEQFYLSILWLWLLGMVPDQGGLYPFFVLYAVWGLISAFSLFFTGFLPRIFALLWHTIFVGYALVLSGNDRLATRASEARRWAFYDSLPVLYLAVTALLQYRRRKTQMEANTLS